RHPEEARLAAPPSLPERAGNGPPAALCRAARSREADRRNAPGDAGSPASLCRLPRLPLDRLATAAHGAVRTHPLSARRAVARQQGLPLGGQAPLPTRALRRRRMPRSVEAMTAANLKACAACIFPSGPARLF